MNEEREYALVLGVWDAGQADTRLYESKLGSGVEDGEVGIPVGWACSLA